MAFVGTYTCHTIARKATYMELSVDGYKLRMIKNIIQSIHSREIMHSQDELERRMLWDEVRRWFNLDRSSGSKLFIRLYEKQRKSKEHCPINGKS